MASNFRDYAFQYVLTDETAKMESAVAKAAQDIQDSRGSSTVVSKWAESIKTWLLQPNADEEGSEGGGNILLRAKALEFLSRTLESLNRNTLRIEQVKMLIGFFGAMFGIDHKAGIAASAKALRHLFNMKAFKPSQGCDIIDYVTNIGDDFRLQSPLTRLEVYELLKNLISSDPVNNELHLKHGADCGFMTDLLEMCRHEREPRNLMIWFYILKRFLQDYLPGPAVTQEVFNTFSAYFPISLRASATPVGVTADDLKTLLRECFSAHHRVAEHVFPFLIQKLDQGDAITVSVKVDILQTLRACLSEYTQVAKSIVPHMVTIWNSLKYEVRNGEVDETIQGTVDAIRTLTSRLTSTSLRDFTQLTLRDCLDDLNDPTHVIRTGRLLESVYTASPAAYGIIIQTLIPHIKMNLRQTKSDTHIRDLITIQNTVLKTRTDILENDKSAKGIIETVSPALAILFDEVLFPLWQEASIGNGTSNNKARILIEVVRGLAWLVAQVSTETHSSARGLLCSEDTCSKATSLLGQIILGSQMVDYSESSLAEIEDEAVFALRMIARSYPAGFIQLLELAKTKIGNMTDVKDVEALTTRLVFIGCSSIPKGHSPLHNLVCLLAAFLDEFERSLASTTRSNTPQTLIGAMHCAMLSFREALGGEEKPELLSTTWEVEVFYTYPHFPRPDQQATSDWRISGIPTDSSSHISGEFSKVCLFTLKQLYRRVTITATEQNAHRLMIAPDMKSKLDLKYLSSMATFITGQLSPRSQQCLSIYEEALCLFREGYGHLETSMEEKLLAQEAKLLNTCEEPGLLELSRGIFLGLWASSVEQMCQSGLSTRIASQLLSNSNSSCSQAREAARSIISTLANKYPRQEENWAPLVELARANVLEALAGTLEPVDRFRRLQICVAFAAGALPNYDKNLVVLMTALGQVPGNPVLGLHAARAFGTLAQVDSRNCRRDHAVKKRLWKQWLYIQLVRPIIASAYPVHQNASNGHNYAVAAMSILQHLPFHIYEDDADNVTRIAILQLTRPAANTDVEAALKILHNILEHKPEILKLRINAVINGSIELLSAAENGKKVDMPREVPELSYVLNPPAYRKLALGLVSRLPLKFEERHLIPHARKLQRDLALASGDAVREVRQAALKARVNWAKID